MEEIGTVLIKMFDWMVRKLKEVRYVPQLKKNLISVGVLEVLSLVYLIEMVFSRYLEARWLCLRASDVITSIT